MENLVNEKIKALINLVYGKTFSEAHLHMLLENIEKAASVITERRKMGWDEKDIVLITYADQFSAKGEKALPVFTRFYNKWLSHSFSHVHLLPFYRGLRTMAFLLLIIMKLRLKREHGETLLN